MKPIDDSGVKEEEIPLDVLRQLKDVPPSPLPDLFYDPDKTKNKSGGFKPLFAFLFIGALVGSILMVPFNFAVSGAARVEPAQDIVIESLVDGELIELYAREGEHVKAGHEIALIYDRTNDQDLVNARADWKMTLQELRQLQGSAKFTMKEARTNRRLYYKDAITRHEKEKSDFEYADVLQEIAIAKTKLENYKAKIRYLRKLKKIGTVRAPLDGIILTKVSHQRSTYFMKGDEILRMADLNHVFLAMPVEEHQLWRIREGAPAKIKFFANPDKIFSGRIANIRYAAYEKTEKVGDKENVIDVLIRLDEKPGFLMRPGAMARVSIKGNGESVFQKLKNTLWL